MAEYRHIPQPSYEEIASELMLLLDKMESDFVRRVLRLFIHQPYKFIVYVLYGGAAEGADMPQRPRFEVTQLMLSLLSATREGDANKLAVIEHTVLQN